MARNKKTEKKPIEQYDHKEKKRVNNPPVGLVTPETDPYTDGRGILQNARYAYDPHLDPQLQWAGKAEHTSFEVPTVSLHVHERIDPRTIIEAVRKKNGGKYLQRSLFAAPEENPPLREAIEFYKHKHNWSNRLIAGDSLLVMNSLLEKEGLAGQVQMIYIDPAKAGMTFLKVQMNADLLTDDLKKKRASNESFWLIGQPDVAVNSGEWLVDSNNQLIGDYEQIKIISGVDSLAEINRINKKDLCLYAVLSQRREIWADFTDAKGRSFDSLQYSRGSGPQLQGRISSVHRHVQGIFSRIGDFIAAVERNEFSKRGKLSDFINRLRGDKQVAEWLNQISFHQPLITRHYTQVELLGFDYYNTKTGTIESGGTEKIALWMLDPDYDGRSLFPRQVFFPMAGEKEGWSRLARNLKAEIDDELIEAYRGTVSLPFEAGGHKRVAVKIVDDWGIESLKIL